MDNVQDAANNSEAAKKNTKTNVISIFAKNDSKNLAGDALNDTEEQVNFLDIMKKNDANKKRLQDERKRTNRNVIRSYRLKK